MLEKEKLNEPQEPKLNIGTVIGYIYVLYNSCIRESSWGEITLHYSKEGAE